MGIMFSSAKKREVKLSKTLSTKEFIDSLLINKIPKP